MAILDAHTGDWAGSNGFRLMPSDPLADAPMRASVALAANGGLTHVTYTWTHPDDGEQEGLLVLGPGEAPGTVVAFWGDSWHQKPEPRLLHGTNDGAVVTVGYVYGGDWRWEIVLDGSEPDRLTLRMDNVIPESAASADLAAGPYAAMSAALTRVS
ncbi:MAG: hypothetical protein Q7T55_05065 [Solirubrobacteraceae bacterium]|nr:hypothetical protein [Solirubrobacteraceae bacterium]